eukprot:466472_1
MGSSLTPLLVYEPFILTLETIKNQRFCIIIDRRNNNEILYIYNAPFESNKFSEYNLNEEYIIRSSQSLFVKENKLNKALFTTYHCISDDIMRCYSFWWNQELKKRIGGRFFKSDIHKVWTKWFNMKDGNNVKFIKEKLYLNYTNDMKINDGDFKVFYSKYTKQFQQNGYNLENFMKFRNKLYKLLTEWDLDKYAQILFDIGCKSILDCKHFRDQWNEEKVIKLGFEQNSLCNDAKHFLKMLSEIK